MNADTPSGGTRWQNLTDDERRTEIEARVKPTAIDAEDGAA